MNTKFYQHYKTKNVYEVLYIANHSETLELLIIYKRVGNFSIVDGSIETIKNGDVWARPKDMFFEKVKIYNGDMVDRFRLLDNKESAQFWDWS